MHARRAARPPCCRPSGSCRRRTLRARRPALAKPRLGRRLDGSGEPGLERRDHRAIDRHRFVERQLAVEERRNPERMGQAANARAVDLRRSARHRPRASPGRAKDNSFRLACAMRGARRARASRSPPAATTQALRKDMAIRYAPSFQARAIFLTNAEPSGHACALICEQGARERTESADGDMGKLAVAGEFSLGSRGSRIARSFFCACRRRRRLRRTRMCG